MIERLDRAVELAIELEDILEDLFQDVLSREIGRIKCRLGEAISQYETDALEAWNQNIDYCSGCEQRVMLEDIELTGEAKQIGAVRATRCPLCGDEAWHPASAENVRTGGKSG